MTMRERRKDTIKKELKKQLRFKFQGGETSTVNPNMINRYLYSIYLDQLKYSSSEYAVDFTEVIFEEYPEFEQYLNLQKQENEYICLSS